MKLHFLHHNNITKNFLWIELEMAYDTRNREFQHWVPSETVILKIISNVLHNNATAWCKKDATPSQMDRSYISLALSHRITKMSFKIVSTTAPVPVSNPNKYEEISQKDTLRTDNIIRSMQCTTTLCIYCKTSGIKCTKSQNSNVSHLVFPLSLPNPLKPAFKSRMKM